MSGEPQRLQKIIAAAGVSSRRKAEALIVAGRVAVNGTPVTELGTRADPASDLVTLDGAPLSPERRRHFVVHKPRGVLCAVRDGRGRPVVVDLLPEDVGERLYPAGRLDLDSEGLVLLTNDGELMQVVTRPGGGVSKLYEATIRGRPADADIARLRGGIEMEGARLLPCGLELLGARGPSTTWLVTLSEGKKNQIRRMFRSIGHRVERLVRTAIGPLVLEGLAASEARELSPEEVDRLRGCYGRAP